MKMMKYNLDKYTVEFLRRSGFKVKVMHVRKFGFYDGNSVRYKYFPYSRKTKLPCWLEYPDYYLQISGGSTTIMITTPNNNTYIGKSKCHEGSKDEAGDSFCYRLGVEAAMQNIENLDDFLDECKDY